MTAMHIVVVTGFYYPYTVPPAGCAKHYLLELAKEHEVEVVCPSSNIHYTKSLEHEGIRINYINSLPNKVMSYIRTNQEEHRWRRFTSLLFTVYRGLRFLKYAISKSPYETSLVKPYLKELCRIDDEHKIDVLISVSFNFYTHAAALAFKKLQPGVRWITYSTDPLAYNEVNVIEKRKLQIAKDIEQEVYDRCDYCITTEEMRSNLVNDYHISPDKVLSLPFLLLDQKNDVTRGHNDRPMALYAGYLYYEIRNPETLLEVFSRIDDVDLYLYYAGDRFIRQMLNKELPSNIHVDGLVSRDKYFGLLNQADVLINLCNKVKLQAPSKLTELVSTGKPIINFYYNKDSGYRMIDKYPLGLNIPNDTNLELAADRVVSFVKETRGKQISFEDVKSLFPEHSLSVQMPKVKEIITSK